MMVRFGVQLLVLGLAGAASAGEIVFTNGNRLSGELVNDVVLVSTGAEVVEVVPDEIRVLTRDTVELRDGRVLRGVVVGGRLRARTPLGELAIHVDQLEAFRSDEALAAARARPTPVSSAPAAAAAPAMPAPLTPEPDASPGRVASAFEPTGPAAPPARAPGAATPAPDAGSAAARDSTEAPAAPTPPRVATARSSGSASAPGPQGFIDGVKKVGHGVAEAADLLHDGFKALGVAIWGAVGGSERSPRAARSPAPAANRPVEVGPEPR